MEIYKQCPIALEGLRCTRKGIIIDKKDYDRLVEIEKNFDEKVKENKESFEHGLKKAIKGDLVKILWTKDKYYADIMGVDLESENINKFVSRKDADTIEPLRSHLSYNRKELLRETSKERNSRKIKEHTHAYGFYQEIINEQKKTIRNFEWAFGILFVAWLILLIKTII